MNTSIRILLSLIAGFTFSFSNAQCDENQTEVIFEIFTDAWGYEAYWELLPEGGECGTDIIESGGNADQVGCDGTLEQDATGGNGYPSNSTITLEPFCLENETTYLITYIDDWGDGGLTINVYQNGVLTDLFVGSGGGNNWEFTIGESSIPAYDYPCIAFETAVDDPSFEINTEEATASPGELAPNDGNCGAYGYWCENGLSRTVWIKFLGPASGAIQISTCNPNTNFDTQIALYRSDDCGDWDNFEFINSNDDTQIGGCDGGNGFASDFFADCLIPDAEYYIQLDGWNGAFGTFEMSILSVDETPIGLSSDVNNVLCAPPKGEIGGNRIVSNVFGLDSDLIFSWTGPNDFTSDEATIVFLEPGIYNLEVSSDCGYEFTGEYEITSPPFPISASVTIDQPNCEESQDGSIEVFPNGGVEPFEFIWIYEEGGTIVSEESLAEGLEPGTYALSMEDNNGCEYNNTYFLSPEGINFSLGNDTLVCQNAAFIIEGPDGYDYNWQDGSTDSYFLFNASEYVPGVYPIVLTASNDEGCNESQAVIVTVEICNSIYELDLNGLYIYPNPVLDNQLNFTGDFIDYKYFIYDSQGKAVLEGTLYGSTLKVNLATGNYIMELRKGNRKWSQPFIIQ